MSYLVSIPAGFSDALRRVLCDQRVFYLIVSIPAGFSDALRRMNISPSVCVLLMFQSLLGFLMRCDMAMNFSAGEVLEVSIPAGFSDALRLTSTAMNPVVVKVSIPAGFSDALRPHTLTTSEMPAHSFNPCWVF